MVNPVEWWDAHWIQDRIERKLRGDTEATGTAVSKQTNAAPAKQRRAREEKVEYPIVLRYVFRSGEVECAYETLGSECSG